MISRADLESTFRHAGQMVAPVHPQQQLSAQQIHAQQAAEAARRERAKRQSRRPTDKTIPDGVDDITIGDGVQRYQALRDVERRLDAVMMRKRLDVHDSIKRDLRRYRTLRIWISNTVDNQPWQLSGIEPEAFDFGTENQATYRLKIEGRLLDDAEEAEDDNEQFPPAGSSLNGTARHTTGDADTAKAENDKTTGPSDKKTATIERTKLSHFFKAIMVDFDRSRSLQTEGNMPIEWKKTEKRSGTGHALPDNDFDCLEIERKGDENANITVNLFRDEIPERYGLSRALSELLDCEEEDRAGVVMGIWEYVKAMDLQEDEENRKIRCDDKLRAVFNTDSVFFPYIPDMILPHLSPLPPLQIPYTIRVDKAFHTSRIAEQGSTPEPESGSSANPQCSVFDILVPLDDPVRSLYHSTMHSHANVAILSRLASLDDSLATIVQAVGHARAKHSFLSTMADDPFRFVRRWVSSQQHDLEILLGERMRSGDEDNQSEVWRKGGIDSVWAGDHARESVALWLARQRQR